MEVYSAVMQYLDSCWVQGLKVTEVELPKEHYYELIEYITCRDNRQVKITDSFIIYYLGREITIKLDQEEKRKWKKS